MTQILIVEDEPPIARLIELALCRSGYGCTIAHDGLIAADLIETNHYDLALLDIMLPGLDGYELLDYLRPQGVPVIFITAKAAVKDRVQGLHRGADDYIVKPFEVEELQARVETVLRRAGKGGHLLTAFDVVLDAPGHTVLQNGRPVELTPPGVCPTGTAAAQPWRGALPRYFVRARLGRRAAGHPHPGPAHPTPAQKTTLGR